MKKAVLALIMGAFFVAPKFHLYKMQVAYVYGERVGLAYTHYERTEKWDDKTHIYDALDDGVDTPHEGDELLTFCVGEGEDMRIISYCPMPEL